VSGAMQASQELRNHRSPFYRPMRRAQAPSIIFREMTVGLNRSEKAVVIDEVAARVAAAKAIVVAEYRGLEVEEITKLRREARQQGVYLRVLKNTLARRAVADTPFAVLSDKLVGPLIYGMSSDPVAVAKVISNFARDNEKLIVKGGALPNSGLDADAVKALATLPSREELLAKLLGTMQAPIAQFVRTLNEVPTKFVRGLAAVRDQKQAA
jgi:large subunit ribosomal protein L10